MIGCGKEMFISSLFVFFLLLNSSAAVENFVDLSNHNIKDLSCLVGICVIAKGCEGNPIWRRVLEWPKWEDNPKECQHAFMIRRNIDPAQSEKIQKEIINTLKRKGEEYFIVMASGGPDGPAREMRLETSQLETIFSVNHDELIKGHKLKMNDRNKWGMQWTMDSYDYQIVEKNRFEAGILARIKGKTTGAEKDEKEDTIVYPLDVWEDFCIFIHSSRSIQHLCGGLERLFQRIPSNDYPMKRENCQDELTNTLEVDPKTGFFHCKPPPSLTDVLQTDYALKTSNTSMEYVRLHYAFCVGGKSHYLVEHHKFGYFDLAYDTRTSVSCGDGTQINNRCKEPEIRDEVAGYCGVRCEKAGKSVETADRKELKCYFLVPVIDGVVYSKGTNVPSVTCDPTGWWRYKKPGEFGPDPKWIDSMYCFYGYKQTDVFSDCVLDRFECGEYGECPVHRQHQVDCDGNEDGRKLAIFHPGYDNSFIQVDSLGCDQKNGWWTVDGRSLPKSAKVDCVWPFELEILKHATEMEDWDPEPVDPRAQSLIGPTVRNASMIVAVVSALLVIVGIIVVCTRLGGPKTRMMTRQLRSFYPSLLNEDERNDSAKAEKEYKIVDSEAAGLILYEIYNNPAYKVDADTTFSPELHTYWISLSWPHRNLLLERALLHRAFFGLKILYHKFKLPEENDCTLDNIRPGLKEKISKASKQYKTLIYQWTPLDLIYSLAFASLSKAELEGFRRNDIKRKILKPHKPKEISRRQESVETTDAPGTDMSKKTTSKGTAEAMTPPTANTAIAPTLDDTATGGTTGKGGSKEKIEETTAPPPDKE